MPLSEIDPLFFKTHGHLIATDGEWAARKGACRVRLNLHGLKIDAIVTHLIGDTFDSDGEDVNEKKRQKQAKELMDFANSRSTTTRADLIILGGDLNLEPSHASYKIIKDPQHGFQDTNAPKVSNIHGPLDLFSRMTSMSRSSHLATEKTPTRAKNLTQ